jgi:hypothetical protein
MSLIRSAQLNGHDPYVYLKDVLNRLPTHRADDIAQLLPHRWAPITAWALVGTPLGAIAGRLPSIGLQKDW